MNKFWVKYFVIYPYLTCERGPNAYFERRPVHFAKGRRLESTNETSEKHPDCRLTCRANDFPISIQETQQNATHGMLTL
jgi:hypothetical protein